LATLGFVFPQKVTGVFEKHLTSKLIEFYREDPDLQNIIDFTQQEVFEQLTSSIIQQKLYAFFFIPLVQMLWIESKWILGLVSE
jgi:hypothetical protein